jgi:hypothetical protein
MGTYTVKVVVSGSSVTCYVGGTQKLTYTITDSALLSGSKVGLAPAATGTGIKFDNFSVTSP